MLSSKIENIAISGTMEISAKTIELRSMGIDVIDLCVGESDFSTPDHIKQAGMEAITQNKTKYTLNTGIKELRSAIAEKFLKEYSAQCSVEEIIVSNGAKQAIYNALQVIINEGDEILIPAPYYVSYPHMVKLAGGIPIYIDTKSENLFKLTSNELMEHLSSKSKALILCNPCNPTGSVFEKDELNDLLQTAYENNLIVICDEIYEKLIYEPASFVSAASLGEKFKDNLIIINGVSKTYAMTGWRIGYAVAPKKFVHGMNKLQSHSTSNACTISQYAALAALTGPNDFIEEQRKTFEMRKNFVSKSLKEIPLVEFIEPYGAFYCFVNIKNLLANNSISNSKDFCLRLLEDAKVAAVPGTAFGAEGYIRISYAKSMEELREAFIRIKKFIQNLN